MEGAQIYPGILLGKKLSHVMFRFHNEKGKLICNRDIVLGNVEATNKIEKVKDIVSEWLSNVEILIEEMETLEKTIEMEIWVDQVRKYELYVEMLKKIGMLNYKCESEQFSNPNLGLKHFSSENSLCFNTKEAAYQLLKVLQNDSIHTIGLYGMQGSGKTKLVKAVGEKAKYLKILDVVLFATMSQNPNVRRIQDEIANSLNLKFDRNTEVGRAKKIYSTLESMDRILVILDDFRAQLHPEDIGIPCNSKRCKVLLTTRHQRECALIGCQREIYLRPLPTYENHSYINDESPSDLLNVAQEVAFQCEGLSSTIKDVGSSLRGKLIEEWKVSLDSLRHSMAQYQIFLSFRGEDTRYSFTGFLYHALCQGGFKTFMDEGGLHSGDQISPSLIKAIEASRLSIVVLSENYAYSSWCLDELVKILECMKIKNQLVWPIFYKVEPLDIIHQKNSYGKAMAKHENRFGSDYEKIQKWRSALFEVSSLPGKTYKIGYEYEFIQKIVEDVNNIKNHLYIRDLD